MNTHVLVHSIAVTALAYFVALTVRAGGIGDYKETKSVAPVPAAQCVWQGFYLGLHAGGEFGHSENLDHNYNVGLNGIPPDKPWGYGESGFVGGGQLGYNWQCSGWGGGPKLISAT